MISWTKYINANLRPEYVALGWSVGDKTEIGAHGEQQLLAKWSGPDGVVPPLPDAEKP